MNPYRFPLALFAFLGIAMVVQPWMWFLDEFPTTLTTEASFLATMVLPATILLFLVSWLQPRGS